MKHLRIVKEAADKITSTAKEPLDGDEVEILVLAFQIELDFLQGNITQTEYDEAMIGGVLEYAS